MNFRLIGILALAVLLFSNCNKNKDDEYDAIDRALILQYLADNNLTAEEHSSGLFYIHEIEGSGGSPSSTATVTIKYKGELLDGTIFDQTGDGQTAIFNLQNLIEGWQIGIPLMKKGGTSQFFVPSNLGYGSRVSSSIPAHSVLIFEVSLIDF